MGEPGRGVRERRLTRKGTSGAGTTDATANVMCFFDGGTVWALSLTCFSLRPSARAPQGCVREPRLTSGGTTCLTLRSNSEISSCFCWTETLAH